MNRNFNFPPSYEESQELHTLEPETGPVYILNAVYDFSAVSFHKYLSEIYNSSNLPIIVEVETSPLWSTITYALDRRILDNEPPNYPLLDTKTLSITYQCNDLEKLVQIRNILHLKNNKPPGVPAGCRQKFLRSNVKYIEDTEDRVRLKVLVQNFNTTYDLSFCAYDCSPPEKHQYSMELLYKMSDAALTSLLSWHPLVTRCFLKQPESITIRDQSNILEHQQLTVSDCQDYFPVVYESSSLEDLNEIKKRLTDPRFYLDGNDPREYDVNKILYIRTLLDALGIDHKKPTREAERMIINAQKVEWRFFSFMRF